MAKEIRTSPTRIYLPSFPLNIKLEILSDSKGIRVTISSERIVVKTIRMTGDPINDLKIAE
jgi:hypothetical protein